MRFHGPRGCGGSIDDLGFVPFAMGHDIGNIGGETVRHPEPFRRPAYADSSLNRWMALTPPELVQGHLQASGQGMQALRTTRHQVVPA